MTPIPRIPTSHTPHRPAPHEGRTVVVGVCTHRRNESLRRLLVTLVGLGESRYSALHLGVVVADDNPDLSASGVVDEFAGKLPLGVRWLPVGVGNISAGRNALLDAAREAGADLVFVDDDDLPEDGWLGELLATADRTSADIVIGSIRSEFPTGTPDWLVRRPGERFGISVADGEEPEVCLSGNALLSCAWLRNSTLRFDDGLGRTGGEDTDFFERAREGGAVVRFSAGSTVVEVVAQHRATARYQLGKEFRRGALARRLERGRMSAPRLALRAGRYVATGAVTSMMHLGRDRGQVFWGLAWAVRGLGMLAGILGLRMRHA